MERLRCCVVTGASRGIGRATAEVLLLEDPGRSVIGTSSRDGSAPAQVKLEAGYSMVRCSNTDDSAIEALYKRIKSYDVELEAVVLNAAVAADSPLAMMRRQDWAATLDTNLTGAFRHLSAAAKILMRQRSGSIVVVTSVAATSGSAFQANYAASKAGLEGMARSLARELGPRGVRVNVVSPGLIDTEMLSEMPSERRQALGEIIPTGRVGRPTEVAHAIEFLCSNKASYINGASLSVDGGLGMGT